MKVNFFKLNSSKSQHPLKKTQRPQSSIFTNHQEAQNDSSKPIRIFNNQLSTKCGSVQVKYASNESFQKEKPLLVISDQITEQIINKPRYNDFKDSYSFNKNKMSEAFTNADSKSYYAKEGELCHGTIENNVSDTTFFSLLPHSHCIEKKTDRDKNCNCSQRNSVRLNTQELIEITNRRKELMSKMEEIEKKRKSSADSINIEPLQSSFEIEYNDKDVKEKEKAMIEDSIIYHRLSIETINQDKDKDREDKEDKIKEKEKDSDSEKEIFSNQFEDNVQFSISMNNNLPKTSNEVSSFDELINFTISKEQFTQIEQSKKEANQSKLEFKIENGSEIIRKHNQPESFCDEEEDLIAIQDPFKGTQLTIKDEVTEINEIDINRNKIQNETKLIIDIDQEEKKVKSNKTISTAIIETFNCLLTYEKNKKNAKNKPDYSKYITKHKMINGNLDNNDESNNEDSIKKLNFFEETLKKIPVNQDKVNEDIIINDAKPLKHQNNRYDQSRIHSMIIPQIQINTNKPLYEHQRILSQVTPTETKINGCLVQRNNKPINTRPNSCNRERNKLNSSPKKKDRQPKKYTDLYMRKMITNEISNVHTNNNNNNDRNVNFKKIHHSCDANELIYNNENVTQRNKEKIDLNLENNIQEEGI